MLAFFKISFGARCTSSRVSHNGVQMINMGSSVSVVAKDSAGAAGGRLVVCRGTGRAGDGSVKCHHCPGQLWNS